MHGVKVMMSVDEGTEDGSLSIMGLLRLSIILVFLLSVLLASMVWSVVPYLLVQDQQQTTKRQSWRVCLVQPLEPIMTPDLSSHRLPFCSDKNNPDKQHPAADDALESNK